MQTKMLNNLKEIFKSQGILVNVKERNAGVSMVEEEKLEESKLEMSKENFFEMLEYLKKAEETSESLFEMGVDLSDFEALYLDAIFLLLSNLFNDHQMNYIHFYIYGEAMDEDFDLFPVYVNKKEVLLKTKEELWKVLNQIN